MVALTALLPLLLASLPLSYGRDRLGLKAHRPSEKLARKQAHEAREAERQVQLDKRWMNGTTSSKQNFRYYNNQTASESFSPSPSLADQRLLYRLSARY